MGEFPKRYDAELAEWKYITISDRFPEVFSSDTDEIFAIIESI